MWKNLRDVRAMAQKIGDVVAPPARHDDDEHDEDGDDEDVYDNEEVNDEEDYDDEEEEVDDDEDVEEVSDEEGEGQGVGFNFVNMITRAIDATLDKSGRASTGGASMGVEDDESHTFPEEYGSDPFIDDSDQPSQSIYNDHSHTNQTNDTIPRLPPRQQQQSVTDHSLVMGDNKDHEDAGFGGGSMSDDDSDLDGKASRVVSRLQHVNDNVVESEVVNDGCRPKRAPLSPGRKIKGPTYSTDSLFKGTVGRQLREQRRQKTRGGVDDTNGESNESENQEDHDIEKLEIDIGDVGIGASLGGSMSGDVSDLDGKDSKPRVVRRLRRDDDNDESYEAGNDNFHAERAPLSPERKLKGATYSTDSLFQGVVGRQLREQRRQKPKNSCADGGTGVSNETEDHEEPEESCGVEIGASLSGSMSGDDSDLDGKDARPRVVRRLRRGDSNANKSNEEKDNSRPQRAPLSPGRKIKATYSTDSLFKGVGGRELREQRRQKTKGGVDVDNASSSDDAEYLGDKSDVDTGLVEVEIGEVQIGDASARSSLMDDSSDLDGKDSNRREVARLHPSEANDSTSPKGIETSPPKREKVSPRRRQVKSSSSTDSLLQGDFGRQLREQRRQKTRRGDGYTSSSRSQSPDPRQDDSGKNRPYHRIVEVPKSNSVLNHVIPSHVTSDEEPDELDVPLHGGHATLPKTSVHSSGHDAQKSAATPVTEQTSNSSDPAYPMSSSDDAKRLKELEHICQQLRLELEQRENQIIELQEKASKLVEKEDQEHDRVMELFKGKEQRLLEAAAEDHQYELRIMQEEMMTRVEALQRELEEERNAFQSEREQVEFLLKESNARADKAEQAVQQIQNQNESVVSQIQQQQTRALRMTEDKLVQALALIDEKEENERNLKAQIQTLQSKMSEHHEGVQEVEEELEELHAENEQLAKRTEKAESENKQLREKVSKLQGDSEKLSHLKLEMRMLKEDNEREKAKRHNVAASAEYTSAQLIADRDAALSEVQDLKQQLAAAMADIEMARGDAERAIIANNNLQAALEAFQAEREAELAIWEENKLADEQALQAAHEAALEATRQADEAQMQLMQKAADSAIKNSMQEIKLLEEKIEMFRLENVQMRRSLDEAINRLQVTQDDVIDRSLMKNVLFDWLTKKGVKERRDVLQVIADMLHFTEEEKEKVHIGHSRLLSTIVGPLPESKADIEHLEGENVREKLVNFLLAETDD